MADTNPRSGLQVVRSERWLNVMLSLFVGACFFALWFWLLPGWLGFRVETGGAARLRWLAAIPSVAGFAVALKCVWDFGWTGRGTPAPFIPPQRLVVVGFYRYVRNPMYVAVVTILLGEAIFFLSWPVLVEAGVFFVLANLFILFYEEPTLRRTFGESYDRYKASVGRWIPKLL